MELIYKTFDGKEFNSEEEARDYEKAVSGPERVVCFEGHSDDIVIIDDEEYYDDMFELTNVDTNITMYVKAFYNGCWNFAPILMDEDDEFPDWEVWFEKDGYSLKLHVRVPEHTILRSHSHAI